MTKGWTLRRQIGEIGLLSVGIAVWCVSGCSSSEPPLGAPATVPGASGATCPETPPTYDSFAKNFFGVYCVRCHSSTVQGSDRHGAPKSVNLDTLEGVKGAPAGQLDQLAAAGPLQQNTFMPPDDPRPSAAERQRLGEWLACGMP